MQRVRHCCYAVYPWWLTSWGLLLYTGCMENSEERNLTLSQPNVGVIPAPDFSKLSLESVVSPLVGEQLRFILFRIVGMSVQQALGASKATQGKYNDWLRRNPEFGLINGYVRDLSKTHRAEAIKLLRRSNQLTAILLEEEIMDRIIREVQSGEYDLIKTSIAKEVYNKLIAVMDATPVFNAREINFIERARGFVQQTGQPARQEVTDNGDSAIEGSFREVGEPALTGAINDTHGTTHTEGT